MEPTLVKGLVFLVREQFTNRESLRMHNVYRHDKLSLNDRKTDHEALVTPRKCGLVTV